MRTVKYKTCHTAAFFMDKANKSAPCCILMQISKYLDSD